MANKIEFCFSTEPAAPEHGSSEFEDDQQDTWGAAGPGPDAYEARKNNEEKLEQLHIGPCTVGEVVRGVGRVLGYELYPSKILHEAQTTKVFLEPSKTDGTELDIYGITDGGEVHTNMVRVPGEGPRSVDHMFVKFRPIFTQPPSVLVGLNYLDQALKGNISATAEQIHEEVFYLSSRGGYSTLHAVGYTWLAIPSYAHPLLQVGSWDSEIHEMRNGEEMVTFKSPYKVPPRVVVWLNSIRMTSKEVRVYAKDITATGFNIYIKRYDNQHARISWFAYPFDTPGICSGTQDSIAGIIRFDKPFTRPPRRILVALTQLFTHDHFPCRFRIVHEAVSAKGMAVRVDTWGDSQLWEVGIAYIAME